MEELNELRKLINKARSYQIKQDTLQNNIFGILSDLNIDIDTKTNAENADNLADAISCYITYGEYSIEGIIKEIKEQLKSK